MAILEKEVWVGLTGHNIEYYEQIGYEVRKSKNKYGRLTVNKGSKILVKIEDLQKGSGVRLTKICDECAEQVPNLKYSQILYTRKKNGKDLCSKCAYVKYGKSRQKETNYLYKVNEKLKDDNREILITKQIRVKNGKKYSQKGYEYKCLNCGNKETISECNLKKGNRCNVCCNPSKKILKGYNDLWTTNPNVANLLLNKEDGYVYTNGSHKKIKLKCPECNHIIANQSLYDVCQRGVSCPECSDGYSYPEKLMFNILKQSKLKFVYQKKSKIQTTDLIFTYHH